jgi:hypothetical protein
MTTRTATETPRNGVPVGERFELGRYTVPVAGQRVLYGQRVNGSVRLVDVPLGPGGRSYLVERELEQDGYAALKALVADYLDECERLGQTPMAASPLD